MSFFIKSPIDFFIKVPYNKHIEPSMSKTNQWEIMGK